MIILGLNCYKHDAAAAVVVDGKLAAAVEEERFTRVKHTGAFPARAARWCLREVGARAGDVDHVAFYMDPALFRAGLATHGLALLARSRDARAFARAAAVVLRNSSHMRAVPARLRALGLVGERAGVHFVEHHAAHAASAFFCSPFDHAAVLSLDGAGEWTSGLLAVGEGIRLERIKTHYLPRSLGLFYLAMTRYLGFPEHGDEYKVMGLASYGEDAYRDVFDLIVKPREDGGYYYDPTFFDTYFDIEGILHSRRLVAALGPPRLPDEPITARHENIAASAQAALDRAGVAIARYLRRVTGAPRLCLAGGVALNCVMNQRIMNADLFDGIFVQPAAHDAGGAVGAALYVYHQKLGLPRRNVMTSAALGPAFGDGEVEGLLGQYHLRAERPADVAATAAAAVADGRLVGWFQGRAEFGPRALGQRSILADPRRAEMKEIVNRTVKQREPFRPFAPSVLLERAGRYFRPARESPFMTVTFDVTPQAREEIPAVVHVDGTSRIQTVRRETNELYYRMLAAFEERTGVGAVLNTSFNVKGEPIVLTPDDALRCYFTTALDALALGPFWLTKS
jgi:carbamoyltransferase